MINQFQLFACISFDYFKDDKYKIKNAFRGRNQFLLCG